MRRRTPSRLRIELQRGGVDAVPQTGWPRTVTENVAEVRVARGAEHLRANHAVTAVDLFVNALNGDRACEARPSAPGIELRVGVEKSRAAAHAAIHAGCRRLVVLAGERPLGGLFPRYGELHRRQLLAPFALAFLDLVRHGRPPWEEHR